MSGSPWLPDWDAGLYAANTGHHRAFDEWFLGSTPLRDGLRLVDLGCGSGDFTRVLADQIPSGEVVGVDPQPGFVAEAHRRAGANQRFVVGTGQELVAALGGERFDGIVSRAALQWAPCSDQARIASQIHASIVPEGFFRLEMSAAGNITPVVELLDSISTELGGPSSPWCFPDPGWYLEVLERAGFDTARGHVRSVAQRRRFTEETLWGWFESQVFQAYELDLTPASRDGFRADVRSRMGELRRHDGSLDQTFVRLDVLAWVSES